MLTPGSQPLPKRSELGTKQKRLDTKGLTDWRIAQSCCWEEYIRIDRLSKGLGQGHVPNNSVANPDPNILQIRRGYY